MCPKPCSWGTGAPSPVVLLFFTASGLEPRGSCDSGSLPLIGGQAVQGTNYLMNYRDTN